MIATTYLAATSVAGPVPAERAINITDTFRAEWTKLRTLRSTWYTLGGAALASIILGALVSLATVSQWDQMTAKERLTFDPTSTALIGVLFASVIVGSLAVRAITSEYSTGMIRVTFAAIPGRRGVMAAKAAILAAVAFPVALVSNILAFYAASAVLSTKHIAPSIGDPGVIQAIVFGALAVSVVTVMGLGLGGIIKRTAGATTALSLVIIGGSLFGIALPAGARQYLPSSALQAVVSVKSASGILSPAVGLVVLAAYAAIAFVVASNLIARRDA
jgi:ABC-2 type transport system permease protein